MGSEGAVLALLNDRGDGNLPLVGLRGGQDPMMVHGRQQRRHYPKQQKETTHRLEYLVPRGATTRATLTFRATTPVTINEDPGQEEREHELMNASDTAKQGPFKCGE
jgi:hypothetical protein